MIFPANAGLFKASKSGMCRVMVVAIGPDSPRLNTPAYPIGSGAITGPDASAEPIEGVVSKSQCFLFILERGDGNDGSKDFFLEDPHPVMAFKNGGFDVIAATELTFESVSFTANEAAGAFLPANVEVGQNLFDLLF